MAPGDFSGSYFLGARAAPGWFSRGTPACSTTKTGRHDIAESGIKHKKSIKSINLDCPFGFLCFYYNKVNIFLDV